MEYTTLGNTDIRVIDLKLTDEDAAFIEEPYRPHEICGANKGMQVLK